jgi:hypothetical protein
MKEYKTPVMITLPISVVEKIEDFRQRYNIKSKGEAYKQLVDMALYVEGKIGTMQAIKDEEVEEIKKKIQSSELVDYMAQIDDSKFRVLMDIFELEKQVRYKQNQQTKLVGS